MDKYDLQILRDIAAEELEHNLNATKIAMRLEESGFVKYVVHFEDGYYKLTSKVKLC